MRGFLSFFILIFLLSFKLQTAFAFPEMVRHGYVNCMSCHRSPTGSGVLTPYGRALSRELLSHRGGEEESEFAYGVIKLPDWLTLGGDIRGLVFLKDTPALRERKAILMQADLELLARFMQFSIGGTLGFTETPNKESATNPFISRRHTVQYQPSDELSFRFGRFQPSFGITTPDHVLVTKRGLGWDQGNETYNLEAAWIGEKYNLFLTPIFGRIDNEALNREKGAALNGSITFLDRFKTGLSYFYGSVTTQRRHVYGPWGILGITPDLSVLSEFDFQNIFSNPESFSQFGFVNYNKIDYEFFQGFHGFSSFELQKGDFSADKNLNKFVALGVQYFPRPHFELSFTLQQQYFAVLKDPINLALLLFHFYP